MFKYILVWVISVAAALMLLALERSIGIDWNYSLDCVTYATVSKQILNEVLAHPRLALNNGYYVIVGLLDQNVTVVTAMNLFLFGLTSTIMARMHWTYYRKKPGRISLQLLLLLFNPYRMHLSTTILKDTIIIFLLVIIVSTVSFRKLAWIPLCVIRLASPLYGLLLLPRKYIFVLAPLGLLFVLQFHEPIFAWLENANKVDMRFREYDLVPNFLSLGYPGIFLRALVWPFLAVTGAFLFLSPTLEFFPVALGSITMQIYSILSFRRMCLTFGAFVAMFVLALMVSGFTTYIRYVYPVIVVLPLAMIRFRLPRRRILPGAQEVLRNLSRIEQGYRAQTLTRQSSVYLY